MWIFFRKINEGYKNEIRTIFAFSGMTKCAVVPQCNEGVIANAKQTCQTLIIGL